MVRLGGHDGTRQGDRFRHGNQSNYLFADGHAAAEQYTLVTESFAGFLLSQTIYR